MADPVELWFGLVLCSNKATGMEHVINQYSVTDGRCTQGRIDMKVEIVVYICLLKANIKKQPSKQD